MLALLTAGASSCGDDEGGGGGSEQTTVTEKPVAGGKVVMGIAGETPTGFNPTSSQFSPSSNNVNKAIYDPIAVLDPDGIAQPYLVENFEPNEDFTEWVFTLREGVTFHNGDPLDAEVFATFLKAVQEGLLTSIALRPMDAVLNLAEGQEAARPMVESGDMSQEDWELMSRQVAVTTSIPWATLPAFFSTQPGFVAHPDYTGTVDSEPTAEEPIGTGPFVFDDWVLDDHLTAVRNPDYWRTDADGNQLPYLDEVEFRPLPDDQTRLASLDTGDIDMMHTNSAELQMQAGADGSGVSEGQYVVFDGGAGDEMTVILNTAEEPLSDVEVRRALALATDKQLIVDGLYDGFFEVANAPYVPDDFWYTDPEWPEPDPDAASQMVEEWEAENGDLVIDLTIISIPENQRLAQTLEEQWSAVGIDVNIKAIDEGSVAASLLEGDYDGIMVAFFPYSDPDEHYHFWDPENIGDTGVLSVNFSRYTSEITKENLQAARGIDDREERKALYADVWKDWAENVPYLFLYHQKWIVIARDNVHGIESVTFPDGSPASPMSWGSIFLTQAWVT